MYCICISWAFQHTRKICINHAFVPYYIPSNILIIFQVSTSTGAQLKKTNIKSRVCLIGTCILFTVGYCLSHAGGTHMYTTTAHKILEMEQQFGLPVDDQHFKMLDEIISASITRVSHKLALNVKNPAVDDSGGIAHRQFDASQTKTALRIIDRVLTESNIVQGVNYSLYESLTGVKLDKEVKGRIKHIATLPISDKARRFLTENSEKMWHIKKNPDGQYYLINCEYLSIIYKSIFEAMGQELHIVKAPGHSFIRWQGNGESLDWETTSSRFYKDQDYIEHFDLEKSQAQRGTFMRSLSDSETFALEYLYLGNNVISQARSTRSHLGDFAQDMPSRYSSAIALYSKAIEVNKTYATAYNNRAMANFEYAILPSPSISIDERREHLEGAIQDGQRAVDLYPCPEFKSNLEIITASASHRKQ